MAISEEVDQALTELRAAITKYYSVIEPDVYVGDWLVVVSKESVSLAANGATGVGLTTPDAQPAYRTAGLLSVAGEMAVYDFDYEEDAD